MTTKNQNKSEKAIASFFNVMSKSMDSDRTTNGLPTSAEFHVNQIVNSGAKSALDVGSGTGSILKKLLDDGIDNVIGIDLSPKMIEIAENKLTEAGYSERSKLINGSFLDKDPESVDAISLHRVLCCHPNREMMLEKSIAHNPEIIIMTLMRPWLPLRFLLITVGSILSAFGKFRPFTHSLKKIEKQMADQGYKLISTKKDLMWVTLSFQKEN